MCLHRRPRSACASAQPDQSLLGALWIATGPKFLQAENLDPNRMAESFKDYSLIQDFEADFPQKVNLKILN